MGEETRTHTPGAFRIELWARWLLAAIALAALVGAALILIRSRPAELAASTLLIIAAVLALLAMVGRLPKSFEVAGVTLEYEQDAMADFIATLRGSGIEDATADELIRLLGQMSVDPGTFRKAKKQANENSREEIVVDEAAPLQEGEAESGEHDEIPDWLNAIAEKGSIHVRRPVRVLGKGSPPIVDFFLTVEGVPTIVETPTSWNPTTLRLLKARVERVLRGGVNVKVAVVVCPAEGIQPVRREMDRIDVEGARVLVFQASDVDPSAITRAARAAKESEPQP